MSSLASFTSAKTNADTFIDSLSNDVIIKTANQNQRMLFGFSSNTSSLIRLGASNVWLGWSNITLSNLGTMNVTSNVTMNTMLYASNVYVGTANTFQHSNYMMYISGNSRIEGDLVVNGTITNVNTNVNVTDQFYVHNMGTGPALVVNQEGSFNIVELQQNGEIAMKLDMNRNLAIGSNPPQERLDVQGDTIARGRITCSNVIGSNIGIISLTTSNIFMGGYLIIDNTGIIQNSNFIPYLDSTKIIGGNSSNLSFSSNYIHDRHIITNKIASNVSIGGFVFMDGYFNIGTQTSNYNPYRLQINDGDIMIKGSNNFFTGGDQARLNLGDSNYFISGCKDLGVLIQASNTSYPFMIENVSGYVGIGTVDPKENLHVIGNTKISSNLYVLNSLSVNTSNAKEVFHVTLGNAHFDSNAYVMNALCVAASNPTERFELRGDNNAKFGSNVYISNALSINTSNPTQKLHVQDGAILINEKRNATRSSFYIQYSNIIPFTFEQDSNAISYVYNASQELQIMSLSNTRFFSMDGGSNTERMRMNWYGQMGIGKSNINTSSMVHIRDMNNLSNAQICIENNQANCMTLGISPGNGNVYFATECNLNMIFQTNAYERMRITSNCLFGFGTSNPNSFFHLHTPSNAYEMTLQISDATNSNGLQITKMGSQDCMIMNTTVNYLAFGTSNTERLRIDSSGKVGIGLTAVGDRLEVFGNIRSSSGTIGPTMMLLPPITYTDVPVNSMLVLDNTIEAGNEISDTTWRPLYNATSFLYNNTSGETIQWNYARLIFRGMSMTLSNSDNTTLSVQEYYYNRTPQYSNITGTFTVSNMSYSKGYKTVVTPWFTNTVNDVRHLAVYVHSSTYNSLFRFGSVYIQYKC